LQRAATSCLRRSRGRYASGISKSFPTRFKQMSEMLRTDFLENALSGHDCNEIVTVSEQIVGVPKRRLR
jgi:hypothetical protein